MKIRRSKQRDQIIQVVKEPGQHPTAEGIYNKLKSRIPSLSLGTVYRNLAHLQTQGLVQKMVCGTTDRFEGNLAPHYHVMCDKCGLVEDVFLPVNSALNDEANRVSTFKITGHRIDFFGICKSCNESNISQPNIN